MMPSRFHAFFTGWKACATSIPTGAWISACFSHIDSDRRLDFSLLQQALPCPRLQPVGQRALWGESALQRGFSTWLQPLLGGRA